ncbi:MAG: polysaccharide biosynthesis tyrosine autokinase [Gammaproteobacteria bacterium]|nr:polysaccharide biosynthesis tyrosine autokinase [Gammaproteobacteria bacterium]
MDKMRKPLDVSLGNDFLEKIELRAILYPIWVNKWFISLIMLITLLIGITYGYLKTPLYSSNVLLQHEENGTLLGIESFPAASLLSSKSKSAADVQTALIKSRYILEPVVRALKLDIIAQPHHFPIIGSWYARLHNGSIDKPWWGSDRYTWGGDKIVVSDFIVPQTEEDKRYTLVALDNNQYELYDEDNQFVLKGEVGKKSSALTDQGEVIITVQTLVAGMNTEFRIFKKPLQQIVDQLSQKIQINDLYQETQLPNPTGILKLTLIGTSPQSVINILNAVANTVTDKNAQKKAQEATQSLGFINQQLPSVKKSLDEAENRLSSYLAKEGMIDISSASKILLNNIIATQKTLNTVQMNKASALKKYTRLHPFIISISNKENYLKNELQSLQKRLSTLPARDQYAVSLMREVKVKNQLYLILLNKIQSLQVAKGSTISDVNVLGYATIPHKPLPIGIFFIGLCSLLTGFILGVSWIFFHKLLNRKISDPSFIESRFGLSNMAIIPYSDKQIRFQNVSYKDKQVAMLAQSDPKNASIEALRSFRTGAQFAMLNAPNNIISILGVSPAVGKSFISVNFAYLQAESGKKIMLIDGDIRKGHLKDYFTSGRVKGLSEVICGTSRLDEVLIKGPLPNLDFLPAGAYPPNPSELLMSDQFKQLLEYASTNYDLVIIDTAPILAVTDAAIIARYASGNFLVLASDTHLVSEIELAIKRFDSNGVEIKGVIFNFSKEQKGIYRNGNIPTYQYQYEYK